MVGQYFSSYLSPFFMNQYPGILMYSTPSSSARSLIDPLTNSGVGFTHTACTPLPSRMARWSGESKRPPVLRRFVIRWYVKRNVIESPTHNLEGNISSSHKRRYSETETKTVWGDSTLELNKQANTALERGQKKELQTERREL